MQCLWREINDRSFENCEQMVVQFKDFVFKSLYHWTASIFFFFVDKSVEFISKSAEFKGSSAQLYNEYY
jgi:hypothetical protein